MVKRNKNILQEELNNITFSEKVHNEILNDLFTELFSEELSPLQLQVLINASKDADKHQKMKDCHMHAMAQSKEDPVTAKQKYFEYLVKKISAYIIESNDDIAFDRLGYAFHAIMDNRSPSHTGFQKWTPILAAIHILRELFPDEKWKDEAKIDLLAVWKLVSDLKSQFTKGSIAKLDIEPQIRWLLNQTRVCQSNNEITNVVDP